MPQASTGPILEKIGQMIADILDGEPEGAFMTAEAGEAWVEASIFKDLGDRVLFRGPDVALFEALLELREAEEPNKRWTTMSFTINNGRFDAQFGYDDDVDQNEIGFERRERLLAERYGDKLVDYSEA